MTNPAIEAAARAIYEYDQDRNSRRASWEGMRIAFPDYNDAQARAVLAAVTPMIRAAALEEAARAFEPHEDGHDSHNDRYFGSQIAAAIRALKEQP